MEKTTLSRNTTKKIINDLIKANKLTKETYSKATYHNIIKLSSNTSNMVISEWVNKETGNKDIIDIKVNNTRVMGFYLDNLHNTYSVKA